MRLIIRGLSLALLGFGVLGMTGCGEDNDLALKDANATKVVDEDKQLPKMQTQEEYFKHNTGAAGAGSGGYGKKSKTKKQ